MNPASVDAMFDWLALEALAGADEATLVRSFSERCISAGFPITRGLVLIDTLHPLYEGRAVIWEDDLASFRETEFQPVRNDNEQWEGWQRSPFFHMLRDRRTVMRCRLAEGETEGYASIAELRDAGQTDYLSVVHRLREAPDITEVDGFYARWTTATPGGFSDAQVDALQRLTTQLALTLRLSAQTRLAGTLVETYLGRDPGRRVLQGSIFRGKVDKISAVLWFSDLSGYTRLSEDLPSDQLIPLLNDYAEAVITAVHDAGGDVLKLIGDGVLAIFTDEATDAACRSAMAAGRSLGQKLHELSGRRAAEGLPVANVHLGVHVGDVYYGNIGSPDRLDFTVVGQAVNEVSRIAAMCHSVDRPILCSSEFIALLPRETQADFVSVGRFALRGVGNAKHLYTLDPALLAIR